MTNDLYRLITRAAFTIVHLSGKSGRTFLIVCQYLKEKKTPYLFDMKSSCVRHLNLMTLGLWAHFFISSIVIKMGVEAKEFTFTKWEKTVII